MMTSKNVRYTAEVMNPEIDVLKEDLDKMIKDSTWDELSAQIN